MTPFLKLTVGSCFRMWRRAIVEWDVAHMWVHGRPPPPDLEHDIPPYRRELYGFNDERWRRLYGKPQFDPNQ